MHTETKLDQGKDPVAGVDLPILSEINSSGEGGVHLIGHDGSLVSYCRVQICLIRPFEMR